MRQSPVCRGRRRARGRNHLGHLAYSVQQRPARFLMPQALQLQYGEARLRHVMCKYDTDRSGSIDLEEFTHYMAVGPALLRCRAKLRQFILLLTCMRKFEDKQHKNEWTFR